MDYNIYNAIKILKKKSGSKNVVFISSAGLAREMKISQQTASRIIINLYKNKFIDRTMNNRKQKITLLEKSLDVLYSELNDLYSILEMHQNFELSGNVRNGLGEGKYYISKEGYMKQFEEKLGIKPYPGTLNVKINSEYENILRSVRSADGIHINGFKDDERTFGGVKCFKAHIDGIKCFLIFPERSSYTDIVEIISDKYLRDELKLNDNDELKLNVDIDN
jgi:riboflavin kinase